MDWLRHFLSWRARANIRKAYHAIAEILFVYLQRKYSRETDEKTALALATAVTLKLLGSQPNNARLRQSLNADPGQVEAMLDRIKDETEVCWIVSLFRHRMSRVPGAVSPETAATDSRLKNLGILLPDDGSSLSSSHRELMQKVQEFEQWSKRV